MIVGLGETGLSFARHLMARGDDFTVMDQNPDPARVARLRSMAPKALVQPFDYKELMAATEILVSPGVPLGKPELQAARASGVPLRGDVSVFAEFAQAPIVAITGTNGKSTVTELVYLLASDQRAGVKMGGNIGTPCLDVLDDAASLYVLELSSYQLELSADLTTEIAVVLNLTADHLDRYPDVDSYFATKLALFDNCHAAVINRDIKHLLPDMTDKPTATFGSDAAGGESDFGLHETNGSLMLNLGGQDILAASELNISGRHNALNVLAALAVGQLLKLDLETMVESVKKFKGLRHRGEVIAVNGGVTFVNDSKATNPGATLAAIEGLGLGYEMGDRNGNRITSKPAKNIVLIMGGDAKGISFDDLREAIGRHVKVVMLIGKSGNVIRQTLEDSVRCEDCGDLDEAVAQAYALATSGDIVLLSPGCSSLDMFTNYAERGDEFKRLVLKLLSGGLSGQEESQ